MPTNFEMLLREPWGILPEALGDLARDYHAERQAGRGALFVSYPGDNAEYAAGVSGLLDVFRRDDPPLYNRFGSVAVVEIRGSLIKRKPRYSFFSCASYEGIREAVQAALDDGGVRAILLDVDSPGGLVNGCEELAEFLAEASAQKRIHPFTDGMCCSAAMRLAAACGGLSATASAVVGSVGTLMAHYSWAKWNEEFGIKPTFITHGEYKAAGNAEEDLSQQDLAYLQERVDESGEVIVNAVATGLGLDPAKQTEWADGKWFHAPQGHALGLVSAMVSNREQLLSQIQEEVRMNRTELMAQDPELYKEIKAEGRKEAEEAAAAQVEEARAQARAEIVGLVGATMGEDAQAELERLVTAGVTEAQARALLPGGGQAKAPDAKDKILAEFQADDVKGVAAQGQGGGDESAARIARMKAIPKR